jgi:UDP-N-acetylglucosamine 3-dehydrogenase
MSRHCRELIARGDLGELRYLGGTFMGFKRARTDVGVTHTDAIHFLDLFNWLTGQRPARVFAVTRDHFGRGMEDLSLVVLEYASGLLARVESGYVQPGRWRDKVVPNAFTSKEVFVVGSRATAELDFETEQLLVHDVHHELVKGIWTAVVGDTRRPNAGTASPVDMVAAELDAFVNATRNGGAVLADIAECGVLLAREIEAIYESARRREPVALQG